MDRQQTATDMAVASFFVDLAATHSISKALADLYEAGVEDGRESVVDDPQAHNLVGLPC